MTRWHVLTENGWIVIESEERPEGNMVHLEMRSCLGWACGWAKVETLH